MTLPTSPAAFRRSLTDRARAHSTVVGTRPEALIEQFLYDRLLARVFGQEPDGWLVKGGQALLRRYPSARATRDLDLLARHDSLDEAVDALRTAAALDLGDFMRFEYRDVAPLAEEHRTRRVRFDTYFGTRQSNVISVDVVAGREPHGEPTVRQLQACIPGTPIDDWPRVALWPIIDHVADKICAMYELHGAERSMVSTRFRDLADLLIIALREPLDGVELHAVLRAEVDRRRQAGTEITLPDRFAVPDPTTWTGGYAQAAKAVAGLETYATLAAATPVADRFITPLLGAQPPDRWDPERLEWVGGIGDARP